MREIGGTRNASMVLAEEHPRRYRGTLSSRLAVFSTTPHLDLKIGGSQTG
jgi:hypothetical protein